MYTAILPSLLLLGGASAAAFPPNGNYPSGPQGSAPSPPSFKLPCDEYVVALATGIHLNIVGQYAEYNGTKAVQQAETTQAGNQTAFLLAKGQLESDIQGGMNIRLFNQEIAPPGNPAIPGLAKYAAAQETEKALAAGLTGSYATDKTAINSLLTDIMNGIQLNTQNLQAATSQCLFYLQFPPADQMGS